MNNKIENKIRMNDRNQTNAITFELAGATQYATESGRLYAQFDRADSYDEYLAFRQELKARKIKVQAYGRGSRRGRAPTGTGGRRPSDPMAEVILVTLLEDKKG